MAGGTRPAAAQESGPALAEAAIPVPIAPEVVLRDDDGGATMRAVRVTHDTTIDGVLAEPLCSDVQSISDFIQMEPEAGAPATERTEAWVGFDDDNLYVSFRAWDSDMESLVAIEMRRATGRSSISRATATACRSSDWPSATVSTRVGFVRRADMVRDFAQFRFSPRPAASTPVRKYPYEGSLEYLENTAGQLESRERSAEFAVRRME